MAIVDLQRRQTEVGRIRLGQKVPTNNGKSRPTRLETFRFTSPSRPLIEAIARLYGGEVRPWQPPMGASEWEVITESGSIPVVVPPQDVESGQFYELWSRGGVQRRCTGARELLSDQPCVCDPADRECTMHTRVNLMLRDVPGIGVWRLDTGGYYAAMELPGMVELLSRAKGLVEALLELRQRTVTRNGQTKHFVVPVLHVEGFTPGQLVAGTVAAGPALGGATRAAVGSAERPAIGAAPAEPSGEPAPARRDWTASIKAATTQEQVRELWTEAVQTGVMDETVKGWMLQRIEQIDAEADPAGVDYAAVQEAVEGEPPIDPEDPHAEERAIWQSAMDLANDLGELRRVWGEMAADAWAKDDKDLRAYWWARKAALEAASKEPTADAEPEPDKDEMWTAILALGGRIGYNTSRCSQFVRECLDKDVTVATGRELQSVLEYMRTHESLQGEAVPA